MIRLYKCYSDKHPYQVICDLNQGDFWRDWAYMAKLRNMIVHDGERSRDFHRNATTCSVRLWRWMSCKRRRRDWSTGCG